MAHTSGSSTIERFEKMAQADPTNEVGHFSLGKAYLDSGQTRPAIESFQRVLDLNPNIGKVYQLLASALLKENRKAEAIERLTQGVKIAAARGDVMPKNEMIAMLKELGAAVPESRKLVRPLSDHRGSAESRPVSRRRGEGPRARLSCE